MKQAWARAVRRGAGSAGLVLAMAVLAAGPALARDVLGIFGRWGAFRDAQEARCFAIAEPVEIKGDKGIRSEKGGWAPFASVGYWPRQSVRGQVNIRLSQEMAPNSAAELHAGGKRFIMNGGGADIWAKDRRDDAAIVAALRAGGEMIVYARAKTDKRFSDHYELRGAATAIDAAALGCARLR